jgi:ribose transport system permease protein
MSGVGDSPLGPKDQAELISRFGGAQRWRPRTTYLPIWIATAVLFAISPLLASGSLSESSILSLLPFAGALMIASVGQGVVVMSGGFDLSMPGTIAVAAAIVEKSPSGDNSKLFVAILIALAVGLAAGLLSGLFVSVLRVAPIVATLAVNSLLVGTVYKVTQGFSSKVPTDLIHFTSSRAFLGIPTMFVIAVVITLIATGILRRTVIGRRFTAVGANAATARASGIPAWKYVVGAYAVSALCGAITGVLLAGFLQSPGGDVGDFYLLTTVAAVVLGGTPLTGGQGSLIAAAVGALFVTELNQLVVTLGASTGVQYVVQGVIIALGVGIRTIPTHRLVPRRISTSATRDDPGRSTTVAS